MTRRTRCAKQAGVGRHAPHILLPHAPSVSGTDAKMMHSLGVAMTPRLAFLSQP